MDSFEQTIEGWVVMTPKHPETKKPMVWWPSFRTKRTDCIKAFNEGMVLSWNDCKLAYGFRCVRASSNIRLSASVENLKRMGLHEWQNDAIPDNGSTVVLTLPKGAGKGTIE